MSKILIANRGEIACRIIKSAQKMGHSTVAIYSDADIDSKHVKMADEAFNVGPAASSESYLRIDKIIDICKKAKVDMIHPGYGFLSENAEFAVALKEANITFIGPNVEAIKTMGSKLDAKQAVKSYNIPMVPGTDTAITDIDEAKKIATDIGFPILIKASAGGGGKGMRVVSNIEEFEQQMDMAKSEARSSFGDDAVFIEKFVDQPRHIEVQILADNHGNYIHLNERECSIQRRHQKVIEEAPGTGITPSLRDALGKAAIDVARSCNYSGAGTVEFLMDKDDNFYFLEMNTRLQVEHPVTELITGIDIVKQQILIAQNQELKIKQSDVAICGHSIELRVYAEDSRNDFLPDIGKLIRYEIPTMDFVRVDDAFVEGNTIPIYYDPMIAKLIVKGINREDAIEKMKQAINHYKIEGVATTLEFGQFVLNHAAFKNGEYDTKFVNTYYSMDALKAQKEEEFNVAATLASKLVREVKKKEQYLVDQNNSNWYHS